MVERKRPTRRTVDSASRTSASSFRSSSRSSSRSSANADPGSASFRGSRSEGSSARSQRSSSASRTTSGSRASRRPADSSSARSTRTSSASRTRIERQTGASFATPGLWTKDQSRRQQRESRTSSYASGSDQGILQKILSILIAVASAIGRGIVFAIRSLISLCMRSRVALIALIAVFVIGGGALLDFGLNNGKAYPGVRIGDIDVSGNRRRTSPRCLPKPIRSVLTAPR